MEKEELLKYLRENLVGKYIKVTKHNCVDFNNHTMYKFFHVDSIVDIDEDGWSGSDGAWLDEPERPERVTNVFLICDEDPYEMNLKPILEALQDEYKSSYHKTPHSKYHKSIEYEILDEVVLEEPEKLNQLIINGVIYVPLKDDEKKCYMCILKELCNQTKKPCELFEGCGYFVKQVKSYV